MMPVQKSSMEAALSLHWQSCSTENRFKHILDGLSETPIEHKVKSCPCWKVMFGTKNESTSSWVDFYSFSHRKCTPKPCWSEPKCTWLWRIDIQMNLGVPICTLVHLGSYHHSMIIYANWKIAQKVHKPLASQIRHNFVRVIPQASQRIFTSFNMHASTLIEDTLTVSWWQ